MTIEAGGRFAITFDFLEAASVAGGVMGTVNYVVSIYLLYIRVVITLFTIACSRQGALATVQCSSLS